MMRRAPRLLAVIVGMLGPIAASADPVFDQQRLFTTAAERERIDAKGSRDAAPTSPEPRVSDNAASPAVIRVHGYVRRERGPDTAWVRVDGKVETRSEPEIRAGRVTIASPDGRVRRVLPGLRVGDP